MTRWLPLAALALFVSGGASQAMVLSCLPVGPKGQRNIEAFVDAYVPGDYPPKTLDSVSVIARMGEDIYDYSTEHTKLAEIRGDGLRIHLLQPLSAGATAEVRFEGTIAPKKGEPFALQMFVRNERRSAQGSVRCTIE